MAKTKFDLNFDGFLELAERIDELGDGYLKEAVENAMQKSKDYANEQILNALDKSPYSFNKGENYSRGKTKKSLEEVSKMPLEWDGNVVRGYVGVSYHDAPEIIFTAYGTPHMKGDNNLKNAIKVKGKYRKEMDKIQQEEFMKVLNKGMEDNK